MFENFQIDSDDDDDDFGGYFLKPANEYNIIDKIKEANKELFSTLNSSSPEMESNEDNNRQQQRKVSFRENLVDYEPINSDNENVTIDEITEEIVQLNENELNNFGNNNLENSYPRKSILISDTLELIQVESTVSKNEIKNSVLLNHENEDDIEEICEEIIELDVNTNVISTNNAQMENQNQDDNCKNVKNEKEMIPIRNSPPPRPLNLNDDTLPIKNDSDENDNHNTANSIHDNNNTDVNRENDNDNDDEEDDNLSVIVASYISRNPKEKFIDDKKKNLSTKTTKSNHRINPFKLCRNNKQNQQINDIMRLKLNYKTCCEYRNIDNQKLPKYTGYLSEYGLSKEQWDKREETIQNKRKRVQENYQKMNENETKRNDDNEKAFTNWLKNKMRHPINKTKNMFDFNRKATSIAPHNSVKEKQKNNLQK